MIWTSIRDFAENRYVEKMLGACEQHPKFSCRLDPDSEYRSIEFRNRADDSLVTTITIWRDPMVSEFNATPFRTRDLDHDIGEAINLALYQATKSAGLRPATLGGEGHLHIDFDSLFFDKNKGTYDYKFFRNFVVDWVNHDELYYGALHYDPKKMGASPLLDSEGSMNKFKQWLHDYDAELAEGKLTPERLREFRVRLKDECGFKKGSALSIMPSSTEVLPDGTITAGTIEVRCLRPKKDLNHLKRTVNLIQGRARYLKSIQGKIALHDSGVVQTVSEGVNRFYRYVTEAHLDWNDMKRLMPKTWQKKIPDPNLSDEELFKPGPRKPSVGRRLCQRILIHLLND